jgi:NAD(P)-dependent dehydrogenase (short-subunit alcohol dehydrogenase family)
VVAACLDRFGRVDALYNVAGLSGRRWGDGPLHLCTDEGWRVTLDNNLDSLFYMCRAVIGYWMEQPVGANGLRGTVLNMASVLGVSPEARHFTTHAYVASKSAIIGLSRAMASYYAPHKIRVNAIAPALVRTPMTVRSQNDPAILEYVRRKQPLIEGMVEPEDVARASVFLLSDDSRAITGEIVTVDGGWSVSGA